MTLFTESYARKLDKAQRACLQNRHMIAKSCDQYGFPTRAELFAEFPWMKTEYLSLKEARRHFELLLFKQLKKKVGPDPYLALKKRFDTNLENAKKIRKIAGDRGKEISSLKVSISDLQRRIEILKDNLIVADEDMAGFQEKMRQHFRAMRVPSHLIEDAVRWKLDDPYFYSTSDPEKVVQDSDLWIEAVDYAVDSSPIHPVKPILFGYLSMRSISLLEVKDISLDVSSKGCTFDRIRSPSFPIRVFHGECDIFGAGRSPAGGRFVLRVLRKTRLTEEEFPSRSHLLSSFSLLCKKTANHTRRNISMWCDGQLVFLLNSRALYCKEERSSYEEKNFVGIYGPTSGWG